MLQLVIVLEDWAHSRIGANAVAKGLASCTFKLKPDDVQARVREVLDRTKTEVGDVRHCTVEVTQATEADELATLKLKLQVAVVVG